jgi:EAL domain-containing protein (putative c-di-GMP-specific phosphodiesterase class I)
MYFTTLEVRIQFSHAAATLWRLEGLGVRIAIDDFGTLRAV